VATGRGEGIGPAVRVGAGSCVGCATGCVVGEGFAVDGRGAAVAFGSAVGAITAGCVGAAVRDSLGTADDGALGARDVGTALVGSSRALGARLAGGGATGRTACVGSAGWAVGSCATASSATGASAVGTGAPCGVSTTSRPATVAIEPPAVRAVTAWTRRSAASRRARGSVGTAVSSTRRTGHRRPVRVTLPCCAPTRGGAMRDYSGRTAVITGGGSGIGRALALHLSGLGAKVAVSDISKQNALDTAQACGPGAVGFELDVADREAVFAHADEVAAAFGGVHLVVNNAGVALHGPVTELTDADMRWLMDINYWGVVHGSQAFLPHLATGQGQLANVSSVFGLIAVPKQAAYNAAKFAVRGFTEALRQEMVMTGTPVAVSCIHPGGVRTNIARSARVTTSEDSAATSQLFDKLARTSPEKAAKIIVKALSKEKPRILVGPDAYVMAGLPRLLGTGYERLVSRRSKAMDV
jgi:NAD(P)-dependent dehydrogenase (short-subunit alcohol dehydrogenase family)